ncbi:lipopolysaccharide biosynthesis protein [Pseudomonas trivialis]|uniref:Flippase n=1 Tax=Pseudomonas trivialis TaxID=200450 RepID=A0A0H5AIS8_9PSED|nr:flippase [Pseudomonas trivialis]AKS09580.1 flippase [Pseudomonas trivialis]
MSVLKRIVSGIGANSFGQVVNLLIQLASVPVLIASWGFGVYSEWVVLSAIPTYLALSDLGVTTAASSKVVIWHERGRLKVASAVYSTSFAFLSLAGLSMLLLAVGSLAFFDLFSLLNLKSIRSGEGVLILSALTVYSLLCLFTNMISIRYRAYKALPLSAFIMNVIRMFEWSAALLCAYLTQSLVATSLMLLAVRAIGIVSKNLIANRLGITLRFNPSAIRRRAFVTLIKPSLASLAFPIGLALNVQGLIILLSVLLSPAHAAIFGLYRTISRVLVQFSTVVNQSLWPEISYAFSIGDNQLVRKMIRYALKFSLPIACVMGALVVAFGGTIFDVWSGRKDDYSSSIMLVLIIGALTHVAWQVYWVALMATASYSSFAVVFMLVSIASILAVFYLAQDYGLLGVCYVLVATEVVLFCFAKRGFHRLELRMARAD